MRLGRPDQIRAFLLCLAVLFASVVLVVFGLASSAKAAGDDYPAKWKNVPQDSVVDDWRQYNRECTSFVAWALHSRNGFELPWIPGTRGAADWGYGERSGHVDATAAAGAVAWWDYGYDAQGRSKGGHVAWVESVSADGNSVVIQEYNNPAGSGAYNRRTIARTSVSGYIHFKDLSGPVGGGGGSGSVNPNGYYQGTPPDGMIIESEDSNHWYVGFGGSLIWFDSRVAWVREALLRERDRRHGSMQAPKMTYAQIHAIEYGYGGNRSHVPADNSFFYEVGSSQQYVVQYRYAFSVATAEEVAYLGGTNRAVMVPPGVASRLAGTPEIANDAILKAVSNNTYYHVVHGQLYWANNFTVMGCIETVKGGRRQPVPWSMIQLFDNIGRISGQPTSCSFPHNWALYGPGGAERWKIVGSNPYVRHRYANDLALHCWLGNSPIQVQLPDVAGINQPAEAEPLGCDVEGRMLHSPDGRVDYVRGGKRYHVPTTAVVNCLKARRGTGDPINASSEIVGSYPDAWVKAYCPYEVTAGANFVREDGDSTVWVVGPPQSPGQPGVKRHAGSLCVPDPYTTPLQQYRVHIVPSGETAGHVIGPDFWASGATCQALPQG